MEQQPNSYSLRWALRESEEQLRLLSDNARDCAVFLLDKEGCVTSWNAGAERIFGYRAGEALGKPVSHFYNEEESTCQKPAQELAEAAMVGVSEVQGMRIDRDGKQFLAHIVMTALREENGTLRGFVHGVSDISRHRAADQRFRQVVESAPSAMVMINASGIIEMVNAQTERLFGYARSELLNQPVEILVPSRFAGPHPTMRQAFFRDPAARPMGGGRDLYARRKDGGEFPVEIGLNPIETDEGTKVLSAIVDISDRKQKEHKIQAALEEKNILLGEIHHRVKNNLQIVHSLLDLQSTRITDASVLEMLRDSQNRIRSMALIHQSLYLSNNFACVNIGNVMETLIPALMQSYSIDHSRISYTLTTADVLLPINLAIPCGLIINELISNALKHAFPDQRSGVIGVQIERIAEAEVLLSVSDDGIGIASDIDLRQTTTLGLQLVRLLADQLGATLNINRAAPTRFALQFAMEKPT